MKIFIQKICLILFLLVSRNSLIAQGPFCATSGFCYNYNTQYPTTTLSTSSSSWSVAASCYFGGDYAKCNVVSGNTYEWSTCNDFGGSQGSTFDAEITLFNSSWNPLCFNNNSGRSNCPYAPYVGWTATYTGYVYVLISNAYTSACQNYSGSCATLVWRQSATGTCTGWGTTPTSASYTSSGGSNSFSVYASGSCTYSILNNYTSWISASAAGSTVSYSVSTNPGSARTGYIYVRDASLVTKATFTINQSGASSCTSPIATVNSPSGTSPLNITCSYSGGSGGSVLYKWYSGTSCSGTVLGTNSTYSATTSGYYSCKAYISGYESTCYSCAYGYATITTSCSSPTASVNSPSGTSPLNITCSYSGGSGGSVLYKWYNGTSCSGTVLGTNSTYPVTASGYYTCKAYISGFESTCYSCAYGYATITTTGSISINTSSSIIPPWQRKDEPGGFQGNITVNITPSFSSWRVEVYKNGGTTPIKIYYNTSSNNINFASSDFGTLNESDNISYYAVLDANPGSPVLAVQHTIIIEKKWNYKNVYYYNNGSAALNIPIKYSSTLSADHITIERAGDVAFTLSLFGLVPLPKSGISGSFSIGSTGYSTIPYSTLQNLAPGDFKAKVWAGIILLETQYFDLTKYGKIFTGNSPTNKIVVSVGGIFNEMEQTAYNLRNCYNSCNNSNSFSILSSLENNGFDVWYIAQGNANSIIRNGFDIGKALEKIYSLNPTIQEINIVSHSKGGLDTRAFLSGLTNSYDNTSQISYQNSNVNGKIKKVLFIGTPHNGGQLQSLIGISALINCPGAMELAKITGVIDILNGMQLPTSISYINLAGYKSYIGTTNTSNFYGVPAYLNSASDGFVTIYSNNYLSTRYQLTNSIKQLYQNSPDLLSHFDEHTNSYLTNTDNYHSTMNCLSYNYPTNLSKILAFFNGNPSTTYSNSAPFPSCLIEPPMTPIIISAYKSIVSGARISIKPIGGTIYYNLGITNENGNFSATLNPALSIGDSIKIEAVGIESQIIPVDNDFIGTGKFNIPMIHSSIPSYKIQYPSIKLISQNPVLNQTNIGLNISAINAISYQINNPRNQDSIFTPLSLINGNVNVVLDTGYNQLLIRFIGLIDTVTLAKQVYYLPDSLMIAYASNLIVNTLDTFKGAKLYIDNQFVKDITATQTITKILKGSRECKFTLSGYMDTIYNIDSTGIINLVMQPVPPTIYSALDSNIINFPLYGKIQYRKNVTVMDSAMQSIVSLKQYSDSLPGKGLITKSRKFELRHLNANWSNIKFAAILDQVENLSLKNSYLMKIINDTSFTKLSFDTTNVIYDSLVQKLAFNYINFNNGTANKQALLIMQKKPPVVKSPGTFNINPNDSIIIPLTQFFADPDSLKNDMSYGIVNAAPTGLTVRILNSNVIVKANNCFSGNTAFDLKATHDSLTVTNMYNVTVLLPQAPQITANDSTTFCPGKNVTLKTDTASGLSYQWRRDGSNILGATGPNYIASTNGIYKIQVINSFACIDSSNSIIVALKDKPNVGFTINNSIQCLNENNFVLNDTSTTSSGTLTRLWNFGDTTFSTISMPTKTYSIPNSYFIKLVSTSSNGCQDSVTHTVTVNLSPTPTVTGLTAICENNSTGYTTPINTGRSYRWSITGGTINSGQSTNAINVTWGSAGMGILTAMDSVNATGCKTTTAFYNITINANPTPVITGLTAICENNSTGYSTPLNTGRSYHWTITGGTISAGQNSNAISVSWGSAGVGTLTVMDSVNITGCKTTTGLYNVTLNEYPNPAINGLTAICENNSTGYSTPLNTGRSYRWTITGGTISSSQNSNAISVSWGSAGVGTLTVMDSVNITGCKTTTGLYNVTLNAYPNPLITGLTTICENNATTYSTPLIIGRSYRWTITGGTISSGQNSNSINVNWGSAGNGTLTVMDSVNATGCKTTTGLYNVTLNAHPTPAITGLTTICENNSTTYSTPLNTGRSYRWTIIGGTISSGQNSNSINVSWGSAGVGTLTVMDSVNTTGCKTTTGLYNVTLNAYPTPAITGLTAICENNSTTYSTPLIAGRSYRWAITGGTISSGQNSNAIGVSWGSAGTGTLTVMDSVNTTGCKTTTNLYNVTLNANPTPVITGLTAICENNSTGYLTPLFTGRSYRWTITGGTISSGQNSNAINVNWGSAGVGTLTVMDSVNTTGCKTTTTSYIVTLNANPIPAITGLTAICENNTTGYSTQINTNRSYRWTITGGTIGSGQNTNAINVIWGSAGNGTLTVMDSVNSTGCKITTALFNVIINANPTPAITGPGSVCINSTVDYFTPNNTGRTYEWMITGGSIITGQGTTNISIKWDALGSGTIFVSDSVNSTGCKTLSNVFPVTINSNPTPVISGANLLCANTSSIYSTLNNTGRTFLWTVIGGSIDSGQGTSSIRINWGLAGTGTIVVCDSVNTTGCKTYTPAYNVTKYANPTPAIVGPAQVCANTIRNYFTSTNTDRSYLWNVIGGTIDTGQGTSSVNINWDATGTGTLVLIEYVNSNGCSTTTPIYNITKNSNPTPSISGLILVCANSNSVYSTPGDTGRTYLWTVTNGAITSGQGTAIVTVHWGTTGFGILVVKDSVNSTGCKSISTAHSITINENPVTNILGLTPVCAFSSSVYSTQYNIGSNYLWSVNGGTIITGQSTPTITVNWGDIGTGMLKVIDSINSTSCMSSDTLLVPKLSNPNASFTFSQTQGMLSLIPMLKGLTYKWKFGDGDTSDVESPTHTYLTNGTYIVSLHLQDSNGCSADSSKSIVINTVGLQRVLAGNFEMSAYPNPFQGKTMILLNLHESANINLEVFDLDGRLVTTFVKNEDYKPGKFEFTFDASQLKTAGTVYIVRLMVDDNIRFLRIVESEGH